MVHESRRGDAFVLGASTWRIDDITRDRVIVTPAPGEPGKMPFWRGDGLGRDRELGLAVGRLTGELDLALRGASVDEVAAALAARTPIEPAAARDLVEHVAQQRQAHGAVPTDRVIVIERFRDQLGDWRVCILSPLGQRVHTPWGLLIARRLEAALGYPAQLVTADDGISLRVADGDEQLDPALLLPSPDELDELLHAELGRSARFAALFRENAARALLLPRRRPGVRTPLWAQRQRAAALLSVAREHAEFPIVLETMRECLQDAFDLEGLRALLTDVASGAVRTVAVTSEAPSPFAASLVFAFVATFLYDGDAPVAERQAQALAVDQRLLGELLGGAPRPVALPPGPETARARAEVVAEVSALADGYQARSGDELHDLLRRLGDLAPGELAARVAPGLDVAAALGGLAAQGRAREVALAGTTRWIACDDEARYRALADAPTPALVAALLPRHVGGAGPQTAPALAARWGLGRALVDDAGRRVVDARAGAPRPAPRPQPAARQPGAGAHRDPGHVRPALARRRRRAPGPGRAARRARAARGRAAIVRGAGGELPARAGGRLHAADARRAGRARRGGLARRRRARRQGRAHRAGEPGRRRAAGARRGLHQPRGEPRAAARAPRS
jgi:ATP-dependent Lhr-like helicase